MPAERELPLLWFGLFRSRRELDSSDLEALIADSARGRAYAGPLRFAETRELYGTKSARSPSPAEGVQLTSALAGRFRPRRAFAA